MLTFIARRAMIAAPILAGLLTINFFLIHAAPGDPVDIYLNPNMDEEVEEMIRRNYGLDKPVGVQYLLYLKNTFIDFDLGRSFGKKRPVADVILDALPNTIILSASALLIEAVIGIGIGILAAAKQHSWIDSTTRVAALTFYSMPSFYLGLLFLFLLAGGVFNVLPGAGMQDPVMFDDFTWPEKLWDRLTHLLLPALTLGIGAAASLSRYMRGELLEVIRQDYIRTARAKGLRERTVFLRHAVKNALVPVVTILGLSLPFLLSGSVIVENVFAWPGMGRVAVDAAFQRDYPVFLAVNMLFGIMVVLGSLVADVLYAVVDPRVRLS